MNYQRGHTWNLGIDGNRYKKPNTANEEWNNGGYYWWNDPVFNDILDQEFSTPWKEYSTENLKQRIQSYPWAVLYKWNKISKRVIYTTKAKPEKERV